MSLVVVPLRTWNNILFRLVITFPSLSVSPYPVSDVCVAYSHGNGSRTTGLWSTPTGKRVSREIPEVFRGIWSRIIFTPVWTESVGPTREKSPLSSVRYHPREELNRDFCSTVRFNRMYTSCPACKMERRRPKIKVENVRKSNRISDRRRNTF